MERVPNNRPCSVHTPPTASGSSRQSVLVGSMDVDIALDHQKIHEEGYKRIEDLLRGRGYKQGEHPFIFIRTVKVGDNEINVKSISCLESRRGLQTPTVGI